jgi:hypothetical protein
MLLTPLNSSSEYVHQVLFDIFLNMYSTRMSLGNNFAFHLVGEFQIRVQSEMIQGGQVVQRLSSCVV